MFFFDNSVMFYYAHVKQMYPVRTKKQAFISSDMKACSLLRTRD